MRREVSADKKDKELFDRIALRYSLKDQVPSCVIARRFVISQAVSPVFIKQGKADHTILDIACGVGANAEYLQGKYERYYGIDHSSQMIALARERHKNNERVSFISANIKEMVCLEHKADIVMGVGALHHMSGFNDVFRSIKKNITPGAVFIAIEPYGGNPVIGLLRKIRTFVDSEYSPDQIFFKKKDILAILSENGLKDIEIIHQGFFSTPFAQVVLKPQIVMVILSRIAVALDDLIGKYLNRLIGPLSWNIIVRAKF